MYTMLVISGLLCGGALPALQVHEAAAEIGHENPEHDYEPQEHDPH
jgi:hypothetical protein